MTKPNFEAMSRKELLAYMLKHRDDEQAFYAYMDKVHAEPASEFYPAPQSIDELQNFPQLLERFRQEQEKSS